MNEVAVMQRLGGKQAGDGGTPRWLVQHRALGEE